MLKELASAPLAAARALALGQWGGDRRVRPGGAAPAAPGSWHNALPLSQQWFMLDRFIPIATEGTALAAAPALQLCGGNIFNRSKAVVCIVQQRAGALCARGQLQSDLKLDLLSNRASCFD